MQTLDIAPVSISHLKLFKKQLTLGTIYDILTIPQDMMEKTGIQDFNFWKNIALSAIFITITPLAIIISLFSLYYLNKNHPKITNTNNVLSATDMKTSGVSIYASLPADLPSIESSIETADARSELIRNYLRTYHSPLEPYAKYIVREADRNNIDYRLLTAIAQQESNLCKSIPSNTYNCWGWGIHSQGTLGFASYQEGIEVVSKGLKENYIDKGFTSIDDIMSKYTPLSNGSWANGVNKFMFDIEDL